MKALSNTLTDFPVATLLHLIVAVVLGADLLIHGSLSGDAMSYGAVVLGSNGLLSIGRGIRKQGLPNG